MCQERINRKEIVRRLLEIQHSIDLHNAKRADAFKRLWDAGILVEIRKDPLDWKLLDLSLDILGIPRRTRPGEIIEEYDWVGDWDEKKSCDDFAYNLFERADAIEREQNPMLKSLFPGD
jgi:hypothetical protein